MTSTSRASTEAAVWATRRVFSALPQPSSSTFAPGSGRHSLRMSPSSAMRRAFGSAIRISLAFISWSRLRNYRSKADRAVHAAGWACQVVLVRGLQEAEGITPGIEIDSQACSTVERIVPGSFCGSAFVTFAYPGRRFEIALAIVPAQQHGVVAKVREGDGRRQFECGVEVEIEFSGIEAKRLHGEVSVSAFKA